jgi:hypothetical protein
LAGAGAGAGARAEIPRLNFEVGVCVTCTLSRCGM